MMDLENIPKVIAIVTASFGAVGGGYTLWDELQSKDILTWAPEYFEITDGPVGGEFKVTVAREKHRDDCTVTDFTLTVKDSENIVHPAKSSIGKFMGPASDRVDTFAYKMQIAHDHTEKVAPGVATLVAYIDYDCPEGHIAVTYPDHSNLRFMITN